MKITIHQPEHFPYLGFFQKMQAADLFILLDDVQFTKGNFQNRNKFQNAKGNDEWFTITLQQHPNKYLIKDVEVNSELNWRPALINKLKQKFNKDFSEIYSHNKLIDINVASIEYCRKELGITTQLSNEMASMVGIGAQVNANTLGENATAPAAKVAPVLTVVGPE